MSGDEIPEPWKSALERKGISSIRGLASKAELAPMTASRLVKGQGTSVETINAVAWFVFDDDVEYVWRLRGLNVKELGPFTLPDEASLLTEDQRAAVVAVVRAMLSEEVKASLAGREVEPRQASRAANLDARDRAAFEELDQSEVRAQQRRKKAADSDTA